MTFKRTNIKISRSEIYFRVLKNEFIGYNTYDDKANFSKFKDIRLKHFIHQSLFMTSSVRSESIWMQMIQFNQFQTFFNQISTCEWSSKIV